MSRPTPRGARAHIRPVPLLTVFCSLKWNRNGEVPCPSPGACLPSCPDPRRLLRDTGSFLRQPCGERARTSTVLGTSACPVVLRGGSSETASRPPNSGPPRQPGPHSAPTGSSTKLGSCGEGGGGALLRGTRVRRLEPPRWALTQTDARPRPSASTLGLAAEGCSPHEKRRHGSFCFSFLLAKSLDCGRKCAHRDSSHRFLPRALNCIIFIFTQKKRKKSSTFRLHTIQNLSQQLQKRD